MGVVPMKSSVIKLDLVKLMTPTASLSHEVGWFRLFLSLTCFFSVFSTYVIDG